MVDAAPNPVPDADVPPTFPVKPKDWVSSEGGRVAMVKDVHHFDGEMLVDLWLYDDDGNRTGRESPVCGGPRTFEPMCSWEGWHRIEEPEFPVAVRWVARPDGSRVAAKVAGRRLPDRRWSRPRRGLPPAPPTPTVRANLDAVGEATALRIAAQRMRDVARKLPTEAGDAVRAEARKAEDEAERIHPRV